MKRAILLLLALGCDDESLPAKVANAQLHGIVAAKIRCAGEAVGQLDTYQFEYAAAKLLDGSCFVGGPTAQGFSQLWPRSEPESGSCPTTTAQTQRLSVDTATGEVVFEGSEVSFGPPTQVIPFGVIDSMPIENVCTGFNIEAFGVEP